MKKLFCVALIVLFALPVLANLPVKKDTRIPRTGIKTLSHEVDKSIKRINTASKEPKKLKRYVCITTTLSCNVTGKICGQQREIPGLYIIAEETHCRFED